MSRKRRPSPDKFVSDQNKRRNQRLDEIVVHTHLNSAKPERISDTEFEEILMHTHLGSANQEKVSITEFERKIGQMHLSRVSNT